jgi:hypothetical protein
MDYRIVWLMAVPPEGMDDVPPAGTEADLDGLSRALLLSNTTVTNASLCEPDCHITEGGVYQGSYTLKEVGLTVNLI